MGARLQCLGSTPARCRRATKSPTDRALRAGPGCRRGLPPSPERLPPFPVDLDGVPVRRLFSVYNPPHERRASISRIRASGLNRRSQPGIVRHARQGSRTPGGLAARGRDGDCAPGQGAGAEARSPRIVDRGAGVAKGHRGHAAGPRGAIRASPPKTGRDPLPPHGRAGRVTSRAMASVDRLTKVYGSRVAVWR